MASGRERDREREREREVQGGGADSLCSCCGGSQGRSYSVHNAKRGIIETLCQIIVRKRSDLLSRRFFALFISLSLLLPDLPKLLTLCAGGRGQISSGKHTSNVTEICLFNAAHRYEKI